MHLCTCAAVRWLKLELALGEESAYIPRAAAQEVYVPLVAVRRPPP